MKNNGSSIQLHIPRQKKGSSHFEIQSFSYDNSDKLVFH